MNLDHEDEQKLTPISAIDINKDKPAQNAHLLICTFSSMEAITLLKQNAKHLPRVIKFNPRVPHQYIPALADQLRQQTQLRMLRTREGNPLVKSRLCTNKGHLILEVADRIGQGWSSFYTRNSFIPESGSSMPTIAPTTSNPKYVLLQYRWDTPTSTETQIRYNNLLTKLNPENFSFNGSKHVLNITIKADQEPTTISEMSKDPMTSSSTFSSIAH